MLIYHPDQPLEEIQPEFKFRGGWAHPDLFHLLAEGKITSTEFVLVLHIDALVDAKGQGCWATNAYFGKILRATPRHITRMIHNLVHLGVVKVKKGRRNVRYLEAFWSRMPRGGQGGGVDINVAPSPTLMSTPSYRSSSISPPRDEASVSAADAASQNHSSPVKKTLTVNHHTNSVKETLCARGGTRESFLPPPAVKKSSPSTEDAKLSRTLYTALSAKGKVLRRYSPKKWANEIRLLREFVSPERLEKAVQYVVANCARVGGPKFPPVRSAASLRTHFGWVEDVMRKDDAPPPALVPEAQRLADNLVRDLRWPKGSDKYVPEAVGRSWSCLGQMHDKLQSARAAGKKANASPVEKFISLCLLPELVIPNFVHRWMKQLHADLSQWGDWSGDRKSFVNRAVSLDNERFDRWGRQLATKWGDSRLWDKVKEVLTRDR